ncbi:hypothetical protein CABS01_17130 [Colletotrichum abscissum]|uniref:uncharacterized protein n=1 Tax=Colletotrichum abscissum TaxID=1671311 RepID=UPI0027D6DCBB|nr:uncharacterized protein CABS01_17130 [Colletotrichum abscissum]KAK1490872.1 hypothetical protein CABS01_17130 [Colletotrichum abscissum]
MAVATGQQTVSVITIPEHRYDHSRDTRFEMRLRRERGVDSWKPEVNGCREEAMVDREL